MTTGHRTGLRQRLSLLCLAVLFAAGGCAHTRAVSEGPIREPLGKVGIVAARDQPDVRLSTKPKGVAHAALSGFGEGFAVGVLAYSLALLNSGGTACVNADCSGDMLLLGGAVSGGIGAIIGSIWSMAVQTRDVPLPQKKRIAGEVRETLWALRPSEELREIVLEASRGMPGCRAVRLPDELSAPSGDSARYGSLSDKGIDTVLEISVPGMGLEGTGGGRSPNLVFFIQTRIRLIRVADGIDLGAPGMDYRGEPHPFPDWAAHTSTMLEEEYEIAVRRTGERIATEVLCPPAAGERAEDPAPPE